MITSRLHDALLLDWCVALSFLSIWLLGSEWGVEIKPLGDNNFGAMHEVKEVSNEGHVDMPKGTGQRVYTVRTRHYNTDAVCGSDLRPETAVQDL